MSGTGESAGDFAGEERVFRVRLGEIRRIELKCGTGIGEVLRRLSRCSLLVTKLGGVEALAAGVDIYADDVREPIYQGLMGAGMSSGEATKLVRLEVDDRGVRGLLDNAATALAVLWAAKESPVDEEDPEGELAAGKPPTTPPSASTSGTSTAPAPPSA